MKRNLWVFFAFGISLFAQTTAFGTTIPGDINEDGYVDSLDLLILHSNWHVGERFTPTPTETESITATPSWTESPIATPTNTLTMIPTPTSTESSLSTPTYTIIETPTAVPTATATNTPNVLTVPLPGLVSGAKPLEMIFIPAGSFMMGSPETERSRSEIESPQHKVTITQSFYLGKYEVTQAQWASVMDDYPAHSYGVGDNYPVYFVNWNACQSFINEMNQLGQGTFRLPTEAEWEYACRAGTTTRYSFGDALECEDTGQNYCEIMDRYMWWYGNNTESGSKEVGLKLPNPWGLFDMHGNIGELCSDYHNGLYYAVSPEVDPQGPATGSSREARGGYAGNPASACRSASRAGGGGSYTNVYGLRLVRLYP